MCRLGRPQTCAGSWGLFVRWLNTPPASNWPPIARAIAAHFYFISVHPFGDGNGRTAFVGGFLLYQAKVNALGFYHSPTSTIATGQAMSNVWTTSGSVPAADVVCLVRRRGPGG
ncbi:MAG: Fic family protein [Dehalococcoidia bacterium]|nr:Fic family protein [Dehalococcoidia bacterium]